MAFCDTKTAMCSRFCALLLSFVFPAIGLGASPAIPSFGTQFGQLGYIIGGAGFAFSPNTSTFVVTSLGYYADGFLLDINSYPSDEVEVNLFDASHSLLASALITPNSPLRNQNCYEQITPTALTLGQTYYVQAVSPINGLWLGHTGQGVIVAPEVNYFGAAYGNPSGPFPSRLVDNPAISFIGANFEFTTVPEPAGAALLLIGFGVAYLGRGLRHWIELLERPSPLPNPQRYHRT
jgi:hypothetical protein